MLYAIFEISLCTLALRVTSFILASIPSLLLYCLYCAAVAAAFVDVIYPLACMPMTTLWLSAIPLHKFVTEFISCWIGMKLNGSTDNWNNEGKLMENSCIDEMHNIRRKREHWQQNCVRAGKYADGQRDGERESELGVWELNERKCENWKRENIKNEMRFSESVLLS